MGAVALLGSGALAGLAGGVEVSGVSYALFQNLSPGYGFTAIAVALLARLHPLGIVATGILFGALEAGAGAMQRDAGVPAVAVYVVEAVVIVVVLLAEASARRTHGCPGGGMTGDAVAAPMAGADVVLGGFLAAAVRVATPLLLAATGETVTERAGVINLGLEGMMLAGALAATLGASAAGPWTGLALAVLAGMLLAAAFAAIAIGARADQIIAGTALTLGAVGLTGTIYRHAYGTGGAGLALPTLAPVPIPLLSRIPILGPALFDQPAPTYLALVALPVVWWVLFRTRPGLALRATGEGAAMARAAGVRTGSSARRRRSWAAASPGSRGRRWCWRRWGRSRRR